MIDLVKCLPFEECEECQCFEPKWLYNKLFGDDKCLVNEINIYCDSEVICREIRKHIKKEAKQDAAE